MNTSEIVCRVIGHKWEVIERIPAPDGLPNGVPVQRQRCKRCGKVVFSASLEPGQAVQMLSRLSIRYEK